MPIDFEHGVAVTLATQKELVEEYNLHYRIYRGLQMISCFVPLTTEDKFSVELENYSDNEVKLYITLCGLEDSEWTVCPPKGEVSAKSSTFSLHRLLHSVPDGTGTDGCDRTLWGYFHHIQVDAVSLLCTTEHLHTELCLKRSHFLFFYGSEETLISRRIISKDIALENGLAHCLVKKTKLLGDPRLDEYKDGQALYTLAYDTDEAENRFLVKFEDEVKRKDHDFFGVHLLGDIDEMLDDEKKLNAERLQLVDEEEAKLQEMRLVLEEQRRKLEEEWYELEKRQRHMEEKRQRRKEEDLRKMEQKRRDEEKKQKKKKNILVDSPEEIEPGASSSNATSTSQPRKQRKSSKPSGVTNAKSFDDCGDTNPAGSTNTSPSEAVSDNCQSMEGLISNTSPLPVLDRKRRRTTIHLPPPPEPAPKRTTSGGGQPRKRRRTSGDTVSSVNSNTRSTKAQSTSLEQSRRSTNP
ncbi:hypothetical protein C8Q75DRAFT_769364 [Abortiporus biennis]|nr:hypothetical protein C8Q75DRAFT_769364 [Abortiporus biennis]